MITNTPNLNGVPKPSDDNYIENHPNKALFNILGRTFSNSQVLINAASENKRHHSNDNNNESKDDSSSLSAGINSTLNIPLENNDADLLLRIIQLCFASMAVSFTTSSTNSPSSTSNKPISESNHSRFSNPSQHDNMITAHEFVMLKQSPHMKSLQQMHVPVIMNPQEYFSQKMLMGDNYASAISPTSTSNTNNHNNTSFSSQKNPSSDVHAKKISEEIQKSLQHRPFVPYEIVYELWKEILHMKGMKEILQKNDLGLSNKKQNKQRTDTPKEASTIPETTLEERKMLARLFFSSDLKKYTSEEKEESDDDDDDDDESDLILEEGMNQCCNYLRDILVYLGVLEIITITTDPKQNQLNADVQGGGGGKSSASVYSHATDLTPAMKKSVSNNSLYDDNDNVTIATGLSDWAGADDFSLFSQSMLSTTKSRRLATFGRIKEHLEEDDDNNENVVFFDPPEKNAEDDDRESDQDDSETNNSGIKHVFFRINHDITQDYGIHLAFTSFLAPPPIEETTNVDYEEKEDDDTQTITNASAPTDMKNPSIRWNRALVRALLIRGSMPLIDQMDDDNVKYQIADHKTVFSSYTKMQDGFNSIDIYVMYAVRMLPRHMIHGSLLTDAAKCLRDKKFIQTRLLSMGVLEGVIRQRDDNQDLKEFVIEGILSKQYHQNHSLNDNNEVDDGPNSEYHSIHYHAQKWTRRIAIKSLELASTIIHQSANLVMSKQQAKHSHDDDKSSDDEEAISLKRKISTLAKELGQSLHTLGVCFGELSMLRLEMAHYEYAYELKKTVLGEDHVSVAETLHCLGAAHQSRGDSYRAMKNYQDALDIFRPIVGEDSLSVADIMHNMGVVYCKTREYDTAMGVFEESLRVRRMQLGDNHEDISDTIQWIGKIHLELGDYDSALKHFKAAHYGKEARFGKQHHAVAECLDNLGIIYEEMGDAAESLLCYKSSLKIKKKNLGRGHPDIADSLQNIANVYKDMKKNGRALACFSECVKILENKMRTEISLFAKEATYSNLIEGYHNVIDLTKMKEGNDHVDVAGAYLNLGRVHDKLNRYEDAIDTYDEALRIWRIEIDHDNISLVLNAMGVVHAKRNFHDKAMTCFDEALYIRKTRLGENNLLVATVHHNIGNTQAKQKEFEKAMICYDEGNY